MTRRLEYSLISYFDGVHFWFVGYNLRPEFQVELSSVIQELDGLIGSNGNIVVE